MKRLILIRHGKTAANEAHLYCGSTNLPLSEQGRAELHPLNLPLKSPTFFSSGLLRTEQTARILFGDVPMSPLPEFREVDFGIFEMRSYAQLKEDAAYQAWISGDNMKNTPPGGESGEAFTARILAALPKLSQVPGDCVLVTHGGVIAAIMAHLFPGEGKNRYEWQPKPGCGYIISEDKKTYTTISKEAYE